MRRLSGYLAHRGPDGDGEWLNNDSTVGFGHRRLAILDLSNAGKQPMVSSNNRLVIVLNGEIYNFIELRQQLKQKGYTFFTETDTEVILNSYLEWGKDMMDKFNGMWAFAIWDIAKQSLFISRDRFGVKPLYYVYQPGHLFAFASESISFHYLEGFKKKVSKQNMNLGIRNTFYLESIGETIYEDIVKLKPGHFLEINKAGKLKATQWWKTEDHLPDVPDDYTEQVDQFRNLFTDACRLRLRSDVPIGIALSGGLDSSSVYSTVQQIYKQDMQDHTITNDGQTAFIASFPDTKMDEKEYADEVIKFYNGKAKYIFPDEKNISGAIYSETKAEDFIYLSPPVVHGIYREMRNNDVKVSLDGHGADEMLFGYANMVGEWMQQEKEEHNFRNLSDTWASMQGISQDEALKVLKSDNGNSRSVLEKAYDTLVPQKVKSIYRKRMFEKNKSSSWLLEFNEFQLDWERVSLKEVDPAYTIPYRKFHVDMLPTLLRNWDRASMRHGVEIRMPFMDWRLITFAFSLPGSSKVGDGYSKKIIRDAMKGWMPEDIRLRKNKIGINAPMEEWFNGPMSTFIKDAVNSKSFLESDIWNGPLLRDYALQMTQQGKWTQGDCNSFWPYLNAWILLN